MKKLITSICLLLFACCFIMTGCSAPSVTMPQNYTNIKSNGGFVVGVDDYLYFANAYQSYSNLQSGDNKGNVGVYKINRIQLDRNNNSLIKEEESVKYENFYNKIAGFETSNMFVVNEYLYFTSPNIHKNDSKDDEQYNKNQFDLVSLFRIKLDGSGFKELYTTETNTSQISLVTVNHEKFIIIFDDNSIFKINAQTNSTKVEKLVDKVESTILPSKDEEIVNIYYTSTRDEDDLFTGNLLNKINLVTGEKVEKISGYSNNKETITIKAYQNGRLFYTRKNASSTIFYSNDFSNGSSSEKVHKYETTIENVNYIKNHEYLINKFVFEYNKNIFVQDINDDNDSAYEKLTSEDSSIAFIDQNYVYYTTTNGIFRISVLTKQVKQISDTANFNADSIDFDGRYVYYFAKASDKTSDTKYLFRADTLGDQIQTECIGELSEDDIKAQEE